MLQKCLRRNLQLQRGMVCAHPPQRSTLREDRSELPVKLELSELPLRLPPNRLPDSPLRPLPDERSELIPLPPLLDPESCSLRPANCTGSTPWLLQDSVTSHSRLS